MKALGLTLIGLAAVLAVLAVADDASATTTCHASNNWCQGYAHVSTTTGGVSSARCFALRTTNTAPTCSLTGITPVNEGTWEMAAGSCVSVYYFDTTTGVTPPAAPNKVTIQTRFDNGGTVIRTLLNAGAEPANSATFSICGTDDGLSTGNPRAGTIRLRLVEVKDNGPGGVGNYNVDSDGGATVGTNVGFDKGAFRSQMLVPSVARNAYPSGSTFAYGSAADELITITATFTQPLGDANVETVRTFIFDSTTFGTYGQLGATVDIDAVTMLAQDFVADNTFDQAVGPWVMGFNLQGNAALTGLRWTTFAATGHGSGITYDADTTVHDTTTFNIDARIRMDSTASGGFASADETDRSFVGATCSGTQVDLFNRGEAACTDWALVNARSEYLSRSMTFVRRDTANAVCASYGSLTPTSNVYSIAGSFSTTGTCIAANDATGTARHLLVTNTDQSYVSGTIYKISSLYFVDAHTQISGTLVQDDYPTENSAEDTTFTIQAAMGGGDASDTVHEWCHVKNVRKDTNIDTSGSAVSWDLKDPTPTTRTSGTTDTGSDGWTPTSLNYLSSTPLGVWTGDCSVSFNGNTGSNAQTFSIVVTGGSMASFSGDPLHDASCTPKLANPSEVILCSVAESNIDGSARTGNAAGTLYDLYVYNPTATAITTGGATTEQGTTGTYAFTWSPGGSPTLGNYKVVFRTTDASPVTSTTTFTIETDPTIALATSLTTVLTDTGLIKGYTDQVEGYTDQVEGYVDQVEGYTDSVEGSLATAATAHGNLQADTDDLQNSAAHADAHHHTIEGYTDGLEAGQADILDGLEAAGVISQAEHQEILDAISQLNSNGTYTNATLATLLERFDNHTEGDWWTMDFDGIPATDFVMIGLWIVAAIWCMRRAKLFAAIAATIGIACVLIPGPDWIGWVGVLFFVLALWLEAVARDRLPYHWFKGSRSVE